MVNDPSPKYQYSYSEHSAPGHMVAMLSRRAERGVVVDLGCGYAELAEPLRDAGFHYIGVDLDDAAIASVRERGFEGHVLDLSRPDLIDALVRLANERRVVAVTAVDVVEHLHPHQPALDAMAQFARRTDALVGLSIPNVAHRDLGVKLVAGRWDVTEIGLLDATHISLFDHRRFETAVATAGLAEVDRFDMIHPRTEQAEPADHPYLRADGVAAPFLHRLRATADPYDTTYQFVRLFRGADPVPAAVDAGVDASVEADGAPVFSVLVPSGAAAGLHDRLASHTALYEVLDGPLDDAIRAARGRYLCRLGADDRVPPSWLATFEQLHELHPDLVLFQPTAHDGGTTVGFDLVQHVLSGGGPSSAIALPLSALRRLQPRLAPGDLAWPVLGVEIAELLGVVDATRLAEVPAAVAGPAAVSGVTLAQYVGELPLLLGAGWHHAAAARAEGQRAAERRLQQATGDLQLARDEVVSLRRELQHRDAMVAEATHAKHAIERSFWWRLTAPGRWAVAKVRSVRRGVGV